MDTVVIRDLTIKSPVFEVRYGPAMDAGMRPAHRVRRGSKRQADTLRRQLAGSGRIPIELFRIIEYRP